MQEYAKIDPETLAIIEAPSAIGSPDALYWPITRIEPAPVEGRKAVDRWQYASDPERERVVSRQQQDPKTSDDYLVEMRAERDRRLTESDRLSGALWSDRWSALTDQQRAEWTAYRQALRDLPETTADPAAPVWPAPPT